MDTVYIGIDVSKAKLDCALTIDGENIKSIKVVKNDPDGYQQLIEWAQKQNDRCGCKQIHFCVEATGIYSESVVEYIQRAGQELVTVSNPAVIKKFGESLCIRTKTDKADSVLIATYAAKMKPRASRILPEEMKRFKQLVRYMQTLSKQRTREVVQLESAKEELIRNSISRLIKEYDEHISAIKKEIKQLADQSVELKQKIRLLNSIPGIADTTAQILLSEFCQENEEGKLSRKAQTAHAGLAPRERKSGSSVKGKAIICRTGSEGLRASLYMPTMSAIQCNPIIKSFYDRLVSKGKNKKVAIIACMRKLMCIAIGVLNNEKEFDSFWVSQLKAV